MPQRKDIFGRLVPDNLSDVKSIVETRLSLESGVAVSSTDQINKGRVFLEQYNGDRISLLSSNEWNVYKIGRPSLAAPDLPFTIVDVYAYLNPPTKTVELEGVLWGSSGGIVTAATNATPIIITTSTNHGMVSGNMVAFNQLTGNTAPNNIAWTIGANSTSTTLELEGSVGNGTYAGGGLYYFIPTERDFPLSTRDGIMVKSTNNSRRYLGTLMTNSNSGFQDSEDKRLVYNYDNKVSRKLSKSESASSWIYGVNVWRPMNGNINNRVEIIAGFTDIVVDLEANALAEIPVPTTPAYAHIGIDRDGAVRNNADTAIRFGISIGSISVQNNIYSNDTHSPNKGFHYYQAMERSEGTPAISYFGFDTSFNNRYHAGIRGGLTS